MNARALELRIAAVLVAAVIGVPSRIRWGISASTAHQGSRRGTGGTLLEVGLDENAKLSSVSLVPLVLEDGLIESTPPPDNDSPKRQTAKTILASETHTLLLMPCHCGRDA